MATMGRAVLAFIDRLPYTGHIDTTGTTTSGHNEELAALINHTLPYCFCSFQSSVYWEDLLVCA